MRVIIMFIIFFSLIIGANFYIFYRLWHLLPINLNHIAKIVMICVSIFLFLSPFISMGLADRLPFQVASFLYKIGTSWLIIMLYLIIIFFLSDIVRITGLFPIKQFMFNSLKGFSVLCISIIIIMSVGYFTYLNKKRVELTIKTEKIICSTSNLKIVAISDLHLGYGIGVKEFDRWVKLINDEKPDILLIVGDVIDNSLKPIYKKNYADIFAKINTKHGIYLALGNHEYISKINKSIDFFTKIGITVLRDSVVLIDNQYYIVGRDDRYNTNRKSIEELTKTLDKSKPVIMLDHQPYKLAEAEKNNVDLYIAGHTHDGQVFPISLITKLMYEMPYGYMKKNNTHYYTTSGIGLWGGKFRIGTRSEYVVINLGNF